MAKNETWYAFESVIKKIEIEHKKIVLNGSIEAGLRSGFEQSIEIVKQVQANFSGKKYAPANSNGCSEARAIDSAG